MTDSSTQQELTAEIVAAFVAQNTTSVEALPDLIRSVYQALGTLGEEPVVVAETVDKPTAVQIRKSVSDDGIRSFIDGKVYKTMKRHLTTHGMTLQDYKARYGLPNDYPSTAPAYSAARSAMAKTIGLGRKAGTVMQKAPKPAATRGRGRPPKAVSEAV